MVKKTRKSRRVSEPGATPVVGEQRSVGVPVVDDATAVKPRQSPRDTRATRRAGERGVPGLSFSLGPSDITFTDEAEGGAERHAVAPRGAQGSGSHGAVDPDSVETHAALPAVKMPAGPSVEPRTSGAAQEGGVPDDDRAIDDVRAVKLVPPEPPPSRRVMARGRRPGRTSHFPDFEPTVLDDVSLGDPDDAFMEAGPDTGEHLAVSDHADGRDNDYGDTSLDTEPHGPAASGASAEGTETAEVHEIPDADLITVGGDDEHEEKLPTIVDLAFELKDRWKLAEDGYYYCYDRDEKEVYRIGVTEASRSESGEAVFEAEVAGGIANGTEVMVSVDALRDRKLMVLFHPDKHEQEWKGVYTKVRQISRSVRTAIDQARDGKTTSANLERLRETLRRWKDEYAASVRDVVGFGVQRWKELEVMCGDEVSGVRDIVSLLRQREKKGNMNLFLVNDSSKRFIENFEDYLGQIEQAFETFQSGEFELAPLGGVHSQEQARRTIDFNTVLQDGLLLQRRSRDIRALGAPGALYHGGYVDKVLHVVELLRVLNDEQPRIAALDDALRDHGRNVLSIVRLLFDAAQEYQQEADDRVVAVTPASGVDAVTPPHGAAPIVPHELARTPPFGVPVVGRPVEHGAGTTGEMHAVREAMPPVAEPPAEEQLEARWDAFVEAWPTAGGERYLITHLKGEPPSAQHKYGLADGPQRILRLLSPDDPLYRPVPPDKVTFQDVTPPLKEGEHRRVVTLSKQEVIDSKERVNVLYDEQLNADKFEGLQQRMQQHVLDMRTFVLNRCLEGFVGPDQQLDLGYLGSDRYHDRLQRLVELRGGIVTELHGLNTIDNIHSIPLRTVTHGIYLNTDFAIKLPEFFVATDDIVEHIAEYAVALQLPVVRKSIEMITQLKEGVTRGSFTTEELLHFQIDLNDLSRDIFDADMGSSLKNILYPTLKALLSYMSLECMSREWVQPPNDPLSKALRDLSIATQMNVVNVAVGRVSKITEAAQRAPRTASTPGTASAPLTPHARPDDDDAYRPILSPDELDALRNAVEMDLPYDEAEAWAGEDPAVSELELDEEDDAQAETQPSVPAVVGPLDRRSRLEARQRRRDTRAVSAERLAQEPTWETVLRNDVEMVNAPRTMRVQVVSVKGDTVTMFGQLSDGASAHLTYTRPSMILWLERNGFSPRSVVEPAVTE